MPTQRTATMLVVSGILTFSLFLLIGRGAALATAPTGDGLQDAPAVAVRAPGMEIAAGPVLNLYMTPSNVQPAWGDVFTYTVVMSNTGEAATGAVMTNTLPEGLTYLVSSLQSTAGSAEYRANSATILWQGDLPPNTPVAVSYRVQLVTAAFIYNTAVLHHAASGAQVSATSSPADFWSAPETIAQANEFDQNLASRRFLAVNSQGQPRIAYASDQGLTYATFASGSWVNARVPITPYAPSKVVLALAADDRAHIVFYDVRGHIWLMRESSTAQGAEAGHGATGAWSQESVVAKDFGSDNDEVADLRIGSDGRLHLVYYDADAPSGWYYTFHDGVAWQPPVLAVDEASLCSNLALDATGAMHLACVKNKELRLYTNNGATPWSHEVVDNVNATLDKSLYSPGLAYDGTTPHLTYLLPNNGLYHVTHNGAWTTTQVDVSPWGVSVANTPVACNIDLRGGQIAIAYAWRVRETGITTHTETVRLATRSITATTWITESADSMSDVSYSQAWARPAVALAGDGRAHLAYYYLIDKTLRHAVQTNSFTYATVAESRSLGLAAATDVGSDASVHVAFLASGLRHAVHYSGTATWVQSLAAAGVSDDAAVGVALDAANHPQIIYQDVGQPIYHAAFAGSWVVQLIDQPGMEGYPAIAADAAGQAYATYVALEAGGQVLRYATSAGATWSTTTLNALGPDAWDNRQAPKVVAQNGRVDLLYADCTAYQPAVDYPISLMLKTLNGGVWSTQTLHTFSGRCNTRLDYRLLGDSTGRVAAILLTADGAGAVTERTFWIATGGAAVTLAAAESVASPASLSGPASVLGGYTAGRTYQLRGAGVERLDANDGNKEAIFQDGNGAASTPVVVAQTLDSSTEVRAAARTGDYGAAVEYSSQSGALAVEITGPKPRPRPSANAVKTAITGNASGVYATERITYTITLEWEGQEYAPIFVYDPIVTDTLTYVDGSLTWGAHIVSCLFSNGAVQCAGEFPPTTAGKLTTQVQFVAEVACNAYVTTVDRRTVANTAQVSIGTHFFQPQAATPLRPPFELRASSPAIRQSVASYDSLHAVLLYTVPKPDVPAALLQCPFRLYVSANGYEYGSYDMRNDGQDADLYAGDQHYSTWLVHEREQSWGNPVQLDLVIQHPNTLFGRFTSDQRTLDVAMVNQDGELQSYRNLLVLTDFRAIFDEFALADADSQSHIKDANHNRILDYYDLVERLRQYAADHQGLVVDVGNFYSAANPANYYADFATRQKMGNDISMGLWLRWPNQHLQHVAIIGTDAVVPYRRLEVLPTAANEAAFARSLPDVARNPTMSDIAAGGGKGYWMSDLAHGLDHLSQSHQGLRWAIGRIFRNTPLELLALIDRMEQPIVLDYGDGQSWVAQTENDQFAMDFEEIVEEFVQPALRRYYGRLQELRFHPGDYPAPTNYPPAGYWLNGNLGLHDNGKPWDEFDIADAVKNLADVLIFVGHGDEIGPTAGNSEMTVGKDYLTNGKVPLILSTGCHNGLLPSVKTSTWQDYWFPNATLNANAALIGTTSYDASKEILWSINLDAYHDRLRRLFLERLFSPRYKTLGDALKGALTAYVQSCDLDDNDIRTIYTAILFGLPTQPIAHPGTYPSQTAAVLPAPSAPAWPAAAPLTPHTTINRSASIQHWEVITNTDGRLSFMLPHNGGLAAPGYAPAAPTVEHIYLLPLAATEINVALTDAQSHAWGAPVELAPSVILEKSLGPHTGAYTLTNPYPANILNYAVYTESQALRLHVILAPLQYNPASHLVTLYDRLDYRLDYTAPPTLTVQNILVNHSTPVQVGQTTLPFAAVLNATQPFSGALFWEVYDAAGVLLDDGVAAVNIGAGASEVAFASDLPDWTPGAKQIVIALAAGGIADGNPVIAGGHALFLVEGRSLTLATDKSVYSIADATATMTATLRDQTGAAVGGQASSLATYLDGAPLALTWQGNGLYTAALDLRSVITGQHFISVTVAGLTAERGLRVAAATPIGDGSLYLPLVQRDSASAQQSYLPLIGRQEE